MRKLLLIAIVSLFIYLDTQAQQVEYKIITSVESIVPGGLGRSRIIDATGKKEFSELTSERSAENDKQNKKKRKEAKVDDFEETKLLNFFSIAGINFQNIASNDALLTSKVNDLINEGWDLTFVTSGVESDGGKGDGQGIFITRFIFKRTILQE
jgi:arginyl-tRNA synthetase